MGLFDFIYRRQYPGLLSSNGPFSMGSFEPNEKDQRYNPETHAMDGGMKGRGYFGPLLRPDGRGVMTELGIGMDINGKEMEIPSMVPTLTPKEVQAILNIKDGEKLPESIYRKAAAFARQRVERGLSPWAGPHEEGAYFNLLRGQ